MCLPLHCLLALTLYFCISAILSASFHFPLRLFAPFLEPLFSLGYGEFLTFFKIGKKKENCPGYPKPQQRTIYTTFCTDAEALLRGLWGAHVCTCMCCNWERWRSYDFPKERKRHVWVAELAFQVAASTSITAHAPQRPHCLPPGWSGSGLSRSAERVGTLSSGTSQEAWQAATRATVQGVKMSRFGN